MSRHYSSPDPRSTKRFMKMPRKERQPAEPKLPCHPSRRALLESLRQHAAGEHMEEEGPWSVAAFFVWWYDLDPTGKPIPHNSDYDCKGNRLPT